MIKTVIIMAGGSGERFWPLSRTTKPKQLLELTASGKTMIVEAVERILPIFGEKGVVIITSKVLIEPISEALSQYPEINVLAEPEKRNTSPCLVYSAAWLVNSLETRPENIVCAVLTADHLIYPDEVFRKNIEMALEHATETEAIVTFGITPNRPETGYGYIECGKSIDDKFLEVSSFKEKPDYNTALEYLKSGNYLWNSGMFFWRLDTFFNQFNLANPESQDVVNEMIAGSFDENFTNLPATSIDYALLEKATKIAVLPAEFNWDDLGSFDGLPRANGLEQKENLIKGDALLQDSNGCIVINQSSSKQLVTLTDCENLCVIVTDDAILVVPKEKSQEVKKITTKLRNQELHNLL